MCGHVRTSEFAQVKNNCICNFLANDTKTITAQQFILFFNLFRVRFLFYDFFLY